MGLQSGGMAPLIALTLLLAACFPAAQGSGYSIQPPSSPSSPSPPIPDFSPPPPAQPTEELVWPPSPPQPPPPYPSPPLSPGAGEEPEDPERPDNYIPEDQFRVWFIVKVAANDNFYYDEWHEEVEPKASSALLSFINSTAPEALTANHGSSNCTGCVQGWEINFPSDGLVDVIPGVHYYNFPVRLRINTTEETVKGIMDSVRNASASELFGGFADNVLHFKVYPELVYALYSGVPYDIEERVRDLSKDTFHLDGDMLHANRSVTGTTLVSTSHSWSVPYVTTTLALSRNSPANMSNIHILFNPPAVDQGIEAGIRFTSDGFSKWCLDDRDCSQSDPITTLLAWYNDSSVFADVALTSGLEALNNFERQDALQRYCYEFDYGYAHCFYYLAEHCFKDPSCGVTPLTYTPNITIVSPGVLEARLVYPFSTHGQLCEGAGCSFDIQIPVATNFNPDFSVKCMHLEPLPLGRHGLFQAVFEDGWTVQPLRSETPSYVTCTVNKMGKYLLVQNTTSAEGNAVDTSQPAPPPAQSTSTVIRSPSIPNDVFRDLYDHALTVEAGVWIDRYTFEDDNNANSTDFAEKFERSVTEAFANSLFHAIKNASDVFYPWWWVREEPCYDCVRIGHPFDLTDVSEVEGEGLHERNDIPVSVAWDIFLPEDKDHEARKDAAAAIKNYLMSTNASEVFQGSQYSSKVSDLLINEREYFDVVDEDGTDDGLEGWLSPKWSYYDAQDPIDRVNHALRDLAETMLVNEVRDAGITHVRRDGELDLVLGISRNNASSLVDLGIVFPVELGGSVEAGVHFKDAFSEFPNWCTGDPRCSTLSSKADWYTGYDTNSNATDTQLIVLVALVGPEQAKAFAARTASNINYYEWREENEEDGSETRRSLLSHDRTYLSLLAAPDLHPVSGMLDLELAFDGSPFGRLCNREANCGLHVEIPINKTAWKENSTALCVWLDQFEGTWHWEEDEFFAEFWEPEPLSSKTPDTVVCKSDYAGRFMVVQNLTSNTGSPVDATAFSEAATKQSAEELTYPPPPPLSQNEVPDSYLELASTEIQVLVDYPGYHDYDWGQDLLQNVSSAVAKAIFKRYPSMIDIGYGEPCLGCVQGWVDDHYGFGADDHDVKKASRLLGAVDPVMIELDEIFLNPSTPVEDVMDMLKFIENTPVRELLSEASDEIKAKSLFISTVIYYAEDHWSRPARNFLASYRASHDTREQVEELERAAVGLGQTLNSLPRWAPNVTNGETVHASRDGVEVGLSEITADRFDQELLVLLPTASGSASVKIPGSDVTAICDIEPTTNHSSCESFVASLEKARLLTMLSWIDQPMLYERTTPALATFPNVSIASGALEVMSLARSENTSFLPCLTSPTSGCGMEITLPVDASLWKPGVPATCARLHPIGGTYEVRYNLTLDAETIPYPETGSAPSTISCKISRPGKFVVVQEMPSPLLGIAAVVDSSTDTDSLRNMLTSTLFDLNPRVMGDRLCENGDDYYYYYCDDDRQPCQQCVQVESREPGLSGSDDVMFVVTPWFEVSRDELRALEFAVWSRVPGGLFYDDADKFKATYVSSFFGSSNATKPTLEVTLDVSAEPVDGSSSEQFKQDIFAAIRSSLLGLDDSGAPFLQKAIRMSDVEVDMPDGYSSSSQSDVSIVINMPYEFLTQAKANAVLSKLNSKSPSAFFVNSSVSGQVQNIEGTFTEAQPPDVACDFCEACISQMYSQVVRPLEERGRDPLDRFFGYEVYELFMDACTSLTNYRTCREVVGDYLFRDSQAYVAVRAGALCNALNLGCGSVDSGCTIRSLEAGKPDQELNFCTNDGTVAGELKGTTEVSLDTGQCFTEDDCEGAQFCRQVQLRRHRLHIQVQP